ncbi:LOW QUALITY PROTEIN: piRNA biogenesis protein EXD1 [Dryobates pubescens]|uniref:LOW QUALITY PROTEIN: piRNA biogenesis protein EXD1 n=1 Tax=Dryobates pubescens TaxID=118200 RepID=UPI0023B93355|nr:LOW QUALITY PROTEIN: piRNA biogenesis protein EXD1 [Dryobates pubescens]
MLFQSPLPSPPRRRGLCCPLPAASFSLPRTALSSERLSAILARTIEVPLKCGAFEGVLQRVSPERALLLRTVKNLDTSRDIPGVKLLYLKQQCAVSVAGEGVRLCQHGKLSWPVVATKCHVSLFDVILLGPQAFKTGLQMVLEDKHIPKVMHDCHWISFFPYHPTCMELPMELCQLADSQKLGREKAIKDYRMNEEGLLIRAAMELKERNDVWEDRDYRDDRDCFLTNKVVTQMPSVSSQDFFTYGKGNVQNARSSTKSPFLCMLLLGDDVPVPVISAPQHGGGQAGHMQPLQPEEEASLTHSGPWVTVGSAAEPHKGWEVAPGPRQRDCLAAPPPFRRLKGETASLPVHLRLPALASRDTTPPHARLASSPGRFGRVPSAISVTTRPYQSA